MTRTLGWSALVCALLLANVKLVAAHSWWYWIWGRTDMSVFVSSRYGAEAEAARRDWAAPHTHLALARSPVHADISMLDGDYGPTGWRGLATVESWGRYWPWACGGSPACRMVHAHARYNSAYGGRHGSDARSDVRGVLCQELGHALGLTHSGPSSVPAIGLPGDCMGKGYFTGVDSNVAGPHSWSDVNARY